MKNLLLIISTFFFFTSFLYADDSIDALECADSFFNHLQNHEYVDAWNILTEDSHERIIKEVIKSYKDAGEKVPSVSDVSGDFAECKTMCTSYWKGFVTYFDPKEALEKSTWTLAAAILTLCVVATAAIPRGSGAERSRIESSIQNAVDPNAIPTLPTAVPTDGALTPSGNEQQPED